MDLAARKNKFVEQFMKIVSPEKIERFEELLRLESTNNKKIVAYTIDGNPVNQSQYIKNNEEALTSFKNGEFKTQDQMRQKYASK